MQAWQLVLTLGLFSSPALSVHPKSASTTYRLGASGKRFVCMHAACCKPFVSGTACRKHCRIQHPVWLGRFGRAVGSCSGSADWYVVMDTEPADELAALSTEELAKAKELANAQMQAETAQAEADEKTAKAKMQADEKAAKAKMHAEKTQAKADEKTQAKADEKAKRQAENAATGERICGSIEGAARGDGGGEIEASRCQCGRGQGRLPRLLRSSCCLQRPRRRGAGGHEGGGGGSGGGD